jgi:DNA-binding GntR family transcriptional regulator
MPPMVDREGKATLTSMVYEALRARVLEGELPPGTKLRLNDLTTEYGVSLGVVREAITRLAEQGLVRANPQRGFSVTPLSIEDLEDLTRARVLVETLALRESIKHGDLAWESTILATHHMLQRTPMVCADGHVSPAFVRAHRAFHHALLAGCGSSRLESVATSLRDCSELYQQWSRELAGDIERDVGEHQRLTQLTLDRDEERAAAALAKHIERTTEALVSYASQQLPTDAQEQV